MKDPNNKEIINKFDDTTKQNIINEYTKKDNLIETLKQ